MSDWKYELDDGLIAFIKDGIQKSVGKVLDSLNEAEKRIAELEAKNERLQDAWFVDETMHDLWDDAFAMQSSTVELEENRKWIPVSERLPEEGKEVLVVFQDGAAVGRHLTNQSYLDNNLGFVKGNVWELGIEGISFWAGEGYEDVTHWMPLPELPAEVQE